MNLQTKAALLVSGLVLVVAPAVALGAKPPAPGGASTPAASQYPKGHAYGFFCKAESKTHVAGTPGTPFSKCVTAMAKLANGSTTSPKTACATLSKKHVPGTQGTPYSACVTAGAQLLKATNP
jgi:hypothetical protein